MRSFSQHADVASDIERFHDYIAFKRFAPESALDVAEDIRRTIDMIREAPERFPRYFPKTFADDTLHRALCARFPNYMVFYSMTENAARVLYVHRGFTLEFEERHLEEFRD